ncbi:sensor domain-containing diguanylate cyclase [Mangrovimicrobium sediminis]|uniref:sensor domain-containing diguanylate cyclase n=1 Tax=Mangrovimicrobium sediminis TaxID=2562682 RepID=UPI0014368B3B|nr:diguanylate cyclase [Haliea sp. SAOS-164]
MTRQLAWVGLLLVLLAGLSLLLAARSDADTASPEVAVSAGASGIPTAGALTLQEGLDLRGQWRFRAGDEPAWATPGFDDSDWSTRAVPGRWPRGGFPESGQIGWYRLTVNVPVELVAASDFQLAVRIGKVISAYEFYAGGQLLGGVGGMPPLGQTVIDQERQYFVPPTAVDAQGNLVLALRVWGGEPTAVNAWGGGPHAGDFLLGEYRSLLYQGLLKELPGMMFFIVTLTFGIHHMVIYWRNRSLRVYLWFGLLALDIALYGLMLTQWKFLLGWPYLVLKKIEFTSIYVFPALALQMVWSLVDRKFPPALRVYQLSFVVFALSILPVPGLTVHFATLLSWQLATLPMFGFVPWMLWREVRAGNREARTLLPALALFLATCVNDILIDLANLETIRLMPFGFIAILASMSMSMITRFTRMFGALESEVEQRTSELREVNLQLVQMARVDHLTGVLNRRGFTEEAEEEVARMQRTGTGFSIVLTDVDFFKRFNDRHGHECGDHVLRRVADILKLRTRDIDQIGRWGGEEFILLLPETDAEGAAVLAEKLRIAVEENVFEFRGEQLSLTMTFGVAAFRLGDNLDTCIARADTALYHGKKDGRNKVMIGKYKGLSLVN